MTKIATMNAGALRWLLALGLLLALCACGDDSGSDGAAGDGDGDGDGDAGEPDAGDGDAVYALATEIETPEGDVLYLSTVHSLTEPFDLVDDGIEIPNASTFQALGDQVFVAVNNSPTITRYVLDENDRLQEDETVSFAGVGVTNAAYYALVSETKAYLFDYEAYTVHVWNPSTMELTGDEIDLSALQSDERSAFWLTPWRFDQIKRDGQLLVGGGFWPDEGPARNAIILVFDTAEDTVKVIDTDRCTLLGAVKLAENGDAYFFGQAYALIVNELEPCALVVRAGEDDIDTSYTYAWSDAFDGHTPRDYNAGPGNTVYVEVPYATDEGESLEDTFYSGGNNARLWRYDLATGDSEEMTDVGTFNQTRWTFDLGDGQAVMPVFNLIDPADEAQGYETEVYEVFEQGEPVKLDFGDGSDEARARLSDVVRLR